jgi:hypothetical protein
VALVTWLCLTIAGLRWAPPGFVFVFVALGIYLVGPLWTPVAYRVDERGVERRTAFGARLWAWDELKGFALDAAERTAWLYPRGRGSARFLPPVLLLWEPGVNLGPALGAWLRSRLKDASGAAASAAP